MAVMRFQPPTVSFFGSIGAVTFETRRVTSIARINNRRRRDPTPRELKRIVFFEAAHATWETMTGAERLTWITAAANAANPPPFFNGRAVTGQQLHTSSYMGRRQAGAAVVASADPDAWIQTDPTALWFEPDVAAGTLTIRSLENDFPAGGFDIRGLAFMRQPIHRSRRRSDRGSSFLATWDWLNGALGFGQPAVVADSPFPLLPGQRFSVLNKSAAETGVVTWGRWVSVLTAPENHGTAGFVRPFFFGLESPSIKIDPGPVVTVVTSIGEFPESDTRDFSSPAGQTVEDVMDWIGGLLTWDVLQRDTSLDNEPASSIEPFGRSVVTVNWQPRAIFVALP